MISAALMPMRRKFIEQLLSRQGLLEALRCAVNEGRAPADAMAEIAQVTHRLSGTAETLGFPRIGRLSQEVDRQITAALHQREQLALSWRAVEPLLEDLLDEMDVGLAA